VIHLVLDSKLDLAIFAIPDSKELGMGNAQPISACLSKWRKIHPETVPVAAKACSNYLNGYLARRDANQRGLMLVWFWGRTAFWRKGRLNPSSWSKTASSGRLPWGESCQASPACPFLRQPLVTTYLCLKNRSCRRRFSQQMRFLYVTQAERSRL